MLGWRGASWTFDFRTLTPGCLALFSVPEQTPCLGATDCQLVWLLGSSRSRHLLLCPALRGRPAANHGLVESAVQVNWQALRCRPAQRNRGRNRRQEHPPPPSRDALSPSSIQPPNPLRALRARLSVSLPSSYLYPASRDPELPWPHRLSSVSSIPFSSLHVDNVRSTYRDIIAARILTRPNLRPSPPGSRLRLVGSVSRLHSSPSRAAFASSSHRCQAAYAALLRGLGGELCFEPYIYIGSPFWAQHTPPVSPTARASVDRHGVQPRHLRRGNVHQQACPRRVCR